MTLHRPRGAGRSAPARAGAKQRRLGTVRHYIALLLQSTTTHSVVECWEMDRGHAFGEGLQQITGRGLSGGGGGLSV